VKFTSSTLAVGIRGNPPFLNEQLAGKINTGESLWMIEDGELHLQLQKLKKAETWSAACMGHQSLDPMMQQEV
jgi:hypothetical protein